MVKEINYDVSATAELFHKDNSFVRGIMGPVGSGKSVACCFEIYMKAKQAEPCKDGIRRSRWIVARNTQPQLETTTIKTWLDWFPEHLFGKMSRKPPFTHKISDGDIELEVLFLALDKPEDVKKLLSFEVTGIWFNEAREIDYELLSAATGRVGRFPSQKDKPDHIPRDKWPNWSGIILDTNPPDDEHWWYSAAEEDGWAYNEDGQLHEQLRSYESASQIPEKFRWRFFKQPSGLDPKADNIHNLPGGIDYYHKMMAGKTKEWINVYVHGNYGTIVSGQPVYGSAYVSKIHKAEYEIPIRTVGMTHVGIDASGRHPAAIFLQRQQNGSMAIVHEFCVTGDNGMGAENYSRLLKQEMEQYFPQCDFDIWGDPAGAWGQNTDERTYFQILEAAGIHCKPSPGLRFAERKEAVIGSLSRFVEGKPYLFVSPRCKTLIRGFEGGYRFKRLNVSGGNRFDDKPDKTDRSADVHDALQYVLCGIGELDRIYGRSKKGLRKTIVAKSGYRF